MATAKKCFFNSKNVFKKKKKQAGEMAWRVRAVTALAEDPVGFPAPTWLLMVTCNSRSRGCDSLFSSGIRHTQCAYIHAGNTFIHIK